MGFGVPHFIIIKLAKNAIVSITVITTLITSQVLPKARDNSVIFLVSISIKPVPRKNAVIEKLPAFIFGRYCLIDNRDINNNKITIVIYETGYFLTGI